MADDTPSTPSPPRTRVKPLKLSAQEIEEHNSLWRKVLLTNLDKLNRGEPAGLGFPELLALRDSLSMSGDLHLLREQTKWQGVAIAHRKPLLAGYLTRHPDATFAAICRFAEVHYPDFKKWRKGELSQTSEKTRRIEGVLGT